VLDAACTALCDEGVQLSCRYFNVGACALDCSKVALLAQTDAECGNRMLDFVNCAFTSAEPCDVVEEVVPARSRVSTDCQEVVSLLASCLAQQCEFNPATCP
jgi:hypothetical protein